MVEVNLKIRCDRWRRVHVASHSATRARGVGIITFSAITSPCEFLDSGRLRHRNCTLCALQGGLEGLI